MVIIRLRVCEAPKVADTKVFSNVTVVMSTVLWIIQIRKYVV